MPSLMMVICSSWSDTGWTSSFVLVSFIREQVFILSIYLSGPHTLSATVIHSHSFQPQKGIFNEPVFTF